MRSRKQQMGSKVEYDDPRTVPCEIRIDGKYSGDERDADCTPSAMSDDQNLVSVHRA
jgi:hypothetical protein